MLTPLEQHTSINSSCKRSRQTHFFAWPHLNRRQLMCRLPCVLVVWTFLAIIVIYKSLSVSDSHEQAIETVENLPDPVSNALGKDLDTDYQPASLRRDTRLSSQADDDYNGRSVVGHRRRPWNLETTTPLMAVEQPIVINSLREVPQETVSSNLHQTSTLKKTITEYNRRSSVFILLVQSTSTSVFRKRKRSPLTDRQSWGGSQYGNSAKEEIIDRDKERSLRIPDHIRLFVEILDAHRIDFVIESTRLGLPTTLLTDSAERGRFSVIVIDDFLRYTKLDRWMRDQLDRHCRQNQIGVVTFLNPDELDNNNIRHSSLTTKSTAYTGGPAVATTTDETIADQFPLALKPIRRRACKKQLNCAYDYQLNDQSSILRILKRKRDFVVTGTLRDSTDSMPWISMSSDHVTYEPLTWVRVNSTAVQSSDRFVSRPRRSTQYNDRTISTSSKDNVLPPMIIADAKYRQDGYGAHERSDRGNQAIAVESHTASSVASIDVITQAYSKIQLQAAKEQTLLKSTVPDDSNNNGRTDDHVNSTMMHEGTEYVHPYQGSSSIVDDTTNNNISLPTNNSGGEDYGTIEPEIEVLSMFDRGLYDGIKRVIFGRANHHWLDRIILLDAIEHLSSGKILTPLERYLQIDIDDIFVGERGKRMNSSDVDALLDVQENFSHLIDGGFKFNLGFSGKYFKHGYESENAGDEYLISKANNFNWFCHTWSHRKAHLINDTATIEMELQKNLQFARQNRLPLIGHGGQIVNDDTPMPNTYAIAPHHSGVYPVHEQLYEAWRKVLNVRVTSTEEYPNLRPASRRRAFVHKTIKVLPRQTCGLYTHTIYRDRYPGGVEKLEANIMGGELFQTILHNPVNIYMTHMSNYAHDRLALSTFSALIEFVQNYTNLQLKHAPSSQPNQLGPSQLANYYLGLFANEQEPIWTNPCKDKRHLAIWAPEKHKYCYVVPQLLIVGPQKTGTTALHSYLKLHPEFRSGLQSPVDFEEVQFFNDKHYFKGVDWYFSRFSSWPADGDSSQSGGKLGRQPLGDNNEQPAYYYFDKSATYFDDPKVASRAKSLLPEARIVILFVDPADRAYSWYQHIKAHGDDVANKMSFEQVIMSRDDSTIVGFDNATSTGSSSDSAEAKVRALRNRCLQPGYYWMHLARWLEHYPSRQIIIIDGQWFRQNPASVMNKLQLILRVEQRLNYENLLVYSEQKGFYCEQHNDGSRKEVRCLGPSKGRKYPAMSREARIYLARHYLAHNKQLARLLSDIGQPLPVWLDEAIAVGGNSRHFASMVFS